MGAGANFRQRSVADAISKGKVTIAEIPKHKPPPDGQEQVALAARRATKFEIPAFKGRSKQNVEGSKSGKETLIKSDKFEIPPFQGSKKEGSEEELRNGGRGGKVSTTNWGATPGLGRAEVTYAAKLEWLYNIHCPQKISQIPSILAR